MSDVLGRIGMALTGRDTLVRILVIGALSLPLACGEPAAPVYARLTITTTALPNAAPTMAYDATLVAAGGDGSYTWLVTAGALPAGLTLADSTGVVSGTPTGSSSTFTVRAASGDGQTTSQQLLIYVYDTLAVTTTALPNGSQGAVYTETLAATGGDGTYTWSVTDGALPPGLSLVASTGVISGTPSAAGSDTLTVRVTSGDGQTAARQVAITVAPVLQPGELCADYPDYAIATFADAALAAAVRLALSVDRPEDLTCGVVAQLQSLSAEYAGIASLAGIQNLTSLTALLLSGNPISDISLLSGLTNLTDLYLPATSISDIAPLSGLTGLRALWLDDNAIGDLGTLSGLTGLQTLGLSNNAISDLSPLSGLTNLYSLYLSGNSLRDISVLSGLTSLTILRLGGNSITDVSALSGLTGLSYLYLADNAISDISALSGLARLRELELTGNVVSDLSPLSSLTGLSYLHLANNTISDVSALSGFPRLWYLDLTDNAISDLSALSGITSLERLLLSGNAVGDLGPLSALANLWYLELARNAITNLNALRGLTSLSLLDLADNVDLIDIQPLLDNTGLAVGDYVFLGGTGVSCTHVAALQAKGVNVESDCP